NVPIITVKEDFQKVNILLCILFWLAAGQLPCVCTSVGEDYDELLPPPSITTDIFTSVFILDNVALTHLTFRKEFTEAMKAKQVAQQFGEEKIEKQHKAAIISAEDDARTAYLLTNSLATTGDGLIELRKLQATEDMAYHLPYSWNITHLPAGPVSDPPASP
ncbi:hypothetical protein U0070_002580, partial [Myodes glareolus]